MKLHVHQSSGAARLLATLTHITSGLSACAADCLPSMAQSASVHPWTSPNVRLHASPTALDTLLPLDGSLCNFISFIGLVTTLDRYDEAWLRHEIDPNSPKALTIIPLLSIQASFSA